MEQDGIKFDSDKLRMELIPPETLENLAKVLTFGANKYSADNWKEVENLSQRYAAAMLRHYVAWQKGEQFDPETGLLHTTHMLASAMFVDWKETQIAQAFMKERLPKIEKVTQPTPKMPHYGKLSIGLTPGKDPYCKGCISVFECAKLPVNRCVGYREGSLCKGCIDESQCAKLDCAACNGYRSALGTGHIDNMPRVRGDF